MNKYEQATVSDSMFPIAILHEGHKSLSYVARPENLPIGRKFTIVGVRVDSLTFRTMDQAIKHLLS